MNDWLDARDRRQAALDRALRALRALRAEGEGRDDQDSQSDQNGFWRTLLALSLNIPGADKMPEGADRLFAWALASLRETCADGVFTCLVQTRDALGDFVLMRSAAAPEMLKRKTVALEAAHPAARLVDIDIYRASGEQLGRREIGLPARACLLCDAPAVECMRTKRHAMAAVIARTHALLKNFGA